MKHYTVLVLLLFLAACGKLNAANYEKIEMGMTYEEVSAILGKADRCDDTAGFKACEWVDGESSVDLRFVGDKVVLRSAKNLR